MSERALRGATRTLIGFLENEIASRGSSAAVVAATPAGSDVTGLSVWLYSVVRDEHRFNDPEIEVTERIRRRTPLPVRLHYMVTPILGAAGKAEEREQELLGFAMGALHDRPVLQGSVLRDDLAGTDARLTVRLEQMPIDELARVWDALNTTYRLSVSYEVSLVHIESTITESTAPVTTVTTDVGVLVGADAP